MGFQGEVSPWPAAVLDIPILGDLELRTEAGEGELGRFYRAHKLPDDELVAGMTLHKDGNRSQEIDTLVTTGNPAFAATAVHALLTKELFGEFSSTGQGDPIPYLSISELLAGQNDGVKRALYDFAFAHDDRLVIPMPDDVVIRSPHADTSLEEDRDALPSDFTGVFSYFSEEASNTSVEEFYRVGTFLGKIVEVHPDEFLIEPAVTIADEAGEPVEVRNKGLHGTSRRIHFLKTMAENDPDLAELIVAG
jgi:hypothetical protein